MFAQIAKIEYHLPEAVSSSADLAAQYPQWTVDKIESKTGISNRHIAGPEECASDLGVIAAKKLFVSGACQPKDVDFLLLCTQSPDYFLPTTACLMQERLGLPTTAGALDFNLGCSGFIYGLGLAKGLIETGQARRVLFITAETYSKFINPGDKSVRTLFGDAAAATLIEAREPASKEEPPPLGPFVYGTDGRGGENLIVAIGGMRRAKSAETSIERTDESGNVRSPQNIYMNGPEIFTFTLQSIPKLVQETLSAAHLAIENVDLFVFHQANEYMLEHLRKRIKIPPEKFFVHLRHCGNTVSSTIPIALKHASVQGRLKPGYCAMLVGFGVGYSWGATLIRWAIPHE